MWARLSGDSLAEFGATVPLQSIENAPAEAQMVWPPQPVAMIPVPDEARNATGFTHLKLYWEAHGHPPQPFLVPHFDFHFYSVSQADGDAIDCADSTKPSQLPPRYELPDVTIPELGELKGLCVPRMGMHAVREEVLGGSEPFTGTMVMGYYGGNVIFVEPMITRSTLLQAQPFTLEVPALSAGAANVRYPTGFRAEYDASARTYRLVFFGIPSS